MKLTKNKVKTAIAAVAMAVVTWGVLFAGTSHATAEEKSLQDHLNLITFSYLQIHESLTADSVDGVRDKANSIIESVDSALKLAGKNKGKAKGLKKALDEVKKAAKPLTDMKLKLDKARAAFAPLSKAVISVVEDYFPPELASRYFVFNCPMKNSNWIQTYPTVRNPYYGSEMIDCGNIVTKEAAASKSNSRLRGNSQASPAPPGNGNHNHYYGCGHNDSGMSQEEHGHYYGCSHSVDSDGYHQHYDGCGHNSGRHGGSRGCYPGCGCW